MDELSALIEEGKPEWYEALCGYCDSKAASWTFAALDPGGGRAKERLLAALWAALGRAAGQPCTAQTARRADVRRRCPWMQTMKRLCWKRILTENHPCRRAEPKCPPSVTMRTMLPV